jgi:uncharacterized protein (DUF305 family)
MMKKNWLLVMSLLLLLTLGTFSSALADKPAEGRAGRSEVRFLEGMMDHHQMAVDMANDCLKKAKTDELIHICNNVITAQTAEIKTMHDWLLNWYQIDYNPMPMSHMMEMMQSHHNNDGMMGDMHGGKHMGDKHQTDAHHPTAEAGSEHSTPEATDQAGDHNMDSMMDMPDDMPMMMGMMSGLSKLEGTEYEVAWLEAMIDHHDDAVHMSNRILKSAEHKELRDMAEKIIKAQTAEIDMMEQLITSLNK